MISFVAGIIDLSAIGFKEFPREDGGRGAIALRNFNEGEILFSISRSFTLSTKTSSLPTKFGLKAWKERKLDKGWSGLILCMMWENSLGSQSKWGPYLATLPKNFDTPMFWNDTDLKELEGTAVVGKLGRDDAERDYHEKVLPAIQSRPDLFPPLAIPDFEEYHMMGSRILSRSFNLERTSSSEGDAEDEEINPEGDKSTGSAMDVDSDAQEEAKDIEDTSKEADDVLSEDEDEENSVVSMVPMADLFNARYGSENAKLFYDELHLKMITTKEIQAGEQIFNTYGDLSNGELLRRYGHVDLLSLPGGMRGNPADVVEIGADLVLSTFSEHTVSSSSTERIDWWLEEGGDDVFILEMNNEIPQVMISFIRLLYLPADEWEKVREKGKPPRPKLNSQVLDLLISVLKNCLARYPSTIEHDEEILKSQNLALAKFHATVVRLGERRIVTTTLEQLQSWHRAECGEKGSTKRKQNSGSEGRKSSKKSKYA
ncbi:hypothetical protein BDP27DRAFT_1225377 [Rhodocollybia butyracea]|uniref:Ribosomal lysine N-methyltransferase 4 n=1 Tax=Rhodocollybia butyracea TaxID=206335 RepID=A0A9P5U6G9_9AGAR|nr:hypothetical protein BDP27DRAFT_1225377 [Rhodocollybia butyracea]